MRHYNCALSVSCQLNCTLAAQDLMQSNQHTVIARQCCHRQAIIVITYGQSYASNAHANRSINYSTRKQGRNKLKPPCKVATLIEPTHTKKLHTFIHVQIARSECFFLAQLIGGRCMQPAHWTGQIELWVSYASAAVWGGPTGPPHLFSIWINYNERSVAYAMLRQSWNDMHMATFGRS